LLKESTETFDGARAHDLNTTSQTCNLLRLAAHIQICIVFCIVLTTYVLKRSYNMWIWCCIFPLSSSIQANIP